MALPFCLFKRYFPSNVIARPQAVAISSRKDSHAYAPINIEYLSNTMLIEFLVRHTATLEIPASPPLGGSSE